MPKITGRARRIAWVLSVTLVTAWLLVGFGAAVMTRVYYRMPKGYRRDASLWEFDRIRVLVGLALGSALIVAVVWGSVYLVQSWSRRKQPMLETTAGH